MHVGTNSPGTSDAPRTDTSITDWDAIEREYRLGIRANTAIARTYGITEGAIRKRAKAEGWTKDLNAQVKATADDLVRKREVRAQDDWSSGSGSARKSRSPPCSRSTCTSVLVCSGLRVLRDSRSPDQAFHTQELTTTNPWIGSLSQQKTGDLQIAIAEAASWLKV